MVVQRKRITQGLVLGLVSFAIIIFSINFEVKLNPGEGSGILYLKIFIPKLLLGAWLGLVFSLQNRQKSARRIVVNILLCSAMIMGLQTIDICTNPYRMELLLGCAGDWRMASFPFKGAWFILLVFVMQGITYQSHLMKHLAFDGMTLLSGIVLLYLPDLLIGYSINDLFMSAFLMLVYFTLTPIMEARWMGWNQYRWS